MSEQSASSKAEGAALVASPTVTWEVWTQRSSGNWSLGWDREYATEAQAREGAAKWPDHRARRVVRVERTVVEEFRHGV